MSLIRRQFYIGSSIDLRRRLLEHNAGKHSSTKRYMPWKVAYYEAYLNEDLARMREKKLKHHGNATKELYKRIGLVTASEKVLHPASLLNDMAQLSVMEKQLGRNFLKYSKNKSGAGFTLIEVMVVMGIFVILSGATLFLTLDAYRGYTFRNDRNTLITGLQKARAQAISNICLGVACSDGMPHGIHVEAGKFVIFQGTVYDSSDLLKLNEVVSIDNSILFSGWSEVVFSQLSGETVTSSGLPWLNLNDSSSHNSVVSVNNEGQIVWTN